MTGTTAVGAHVQASTWTITSGGTVQEMSTKSTEREDQDGSELEISLGYTTPTGTAGLAALIPTAGSTAALVPQLGLMDFRRWKSGSNAGGRCL